MTWRQLLEQLQQASSEQLDKKVIDLIDSQLWLANCYQIADHDDPDLPNNPYLIFISCLSG